MTRLEMIRNAAIKIQGNPEFRATMQKANQRFIQDCHRKIAKIKAKQERQLDKELAALDENYNAIDIKVARHIADETVGEIYRETTKFDNEWN
jgi:hypothetical protein